MRLIASALAILICFDGVSVNATTMQDLLNGGSLEQRDLLFSDFSDFRSMAAGGAQQVAPNQITVATKDDEFGPGLVFDSFAFVVGGINEAQTTSFSFFVRSLSDFVEITDAELNLKVTGPAIAIVDETVSDPSGATLGTNLTFSNPTGMMLTDKSEFTPRSLIKVEKTVTLNGTAGGGIRIDEFRQDFSIPEPSSGLLVVVGVLGFGFIIGLVRMRADR